MFDSLTSHGQLVHRSRFSPPVRSIGVLLGSLCWFLALGCDRPSEVARYRVPKPRVLLQQNHADPATSPPQQQQPSASQAVPARMIAAIVSHGAKSWFFKVTGPVDAVESRMEPFLAFIQSVRFPEGKKTPTWTLPEGWAVLPDDPQRGSGPIRIKRFATLQIGSAVPPLTLAVTSLPGAQGNSDSYVLINVNRWRRQLGLPPLTGANLYSHNSRTEEVRRIKTGDGEATLVNLVGRRAARGGMRAGRPPFAGSGRPAGSSRPGNSSRPQTQAAGVPTYTVPKGWQPGEVRGFRKAAFKVIDGPREVEITVIDLPASGTAANVNRWRGQLGLPRATADELGKQIRTIKMGALTGQYVELVGPAESSPRRTILGVIVLQGRTAWYIKLVGDSVLADREKSRFESFVRSLRFPQR